VEKAVRISSPQENIRYFFFLKVFEIMIIYSVEKSAHRET